MNYENNVTALGLVNCRRCRDIRRDKRKISKKNSKRKISRETSVWDRKLKI